MSTNHTIRGLLEHMYKEFEINRTMVKGGCQSGRKVVPHDSKSDLPLKAKHRAAPRLDAVIV